MHEFVPHDQKHIRHRFNEQNVIMPLNKLTKQKLKTLQL